MPQISKIRIVNFQYNDGRRLIADELYQLENENQEPSDVLINLANGGGKSVLVQLMMQPMIPKARAAGRRIESFFTKATDHCYVLIEWTKDGSREKLMTGIAMAASDASADADSDRGFQIKYYTFLSEYQDYRGSYTITTLPLSRKENGRFIPAAFDEVRNLAKKSGGKLERYSSDDSVRWRDRLAQFGIVQNEWHMIEKLNSNEDGLSKFFATLKTSDALIDELIIPRIEEKQSHSASKDDSSLETMLLSYAKQFSKQQDIIREREILGGFSDGLSRAKDVAEQLWQDNDSKEQCIEKLFAYADALDAEVAGQEEKKEQLKQKLDELSETIRLIQWEKASDVYYTCEDEYERKKAEYEAAEKASEAARGARDEADKKVRLLECADYYGQQQELESERKAIEAEISCRENNTESAALLASLKYSAYSAIQVELKEIGRRLEELAENKESVEVCVEKLNEEIAELEKHIGAAQTAATRAETRLDSQIKENDASVEQLEIEAFRMLDGRYQDDELEHWKSEAQKKKQDALDAIEAAKAELDRLEVRRDEIPQEIADASSRKNELQTKLQAVGDELTEYRSAMEEIEQVYQKYGLDIALCFTEHAANHLSEQLEKTEASIAGELRQMEATEEAIAAVKRGTLHIPKMLSDYLDSTGVHYTSVEKYILTQMERAVLTKEDWICFLEKYPFAAYGVVVDAADKQAICENESKCWLPAILPVFTGEDMETMLNGEASSFASVAAYSKDYFVDSAAYASALQETLAKQTNHKCQLEKRLESLKADAAIVRAFSSYDECWEGRTLAKYKKLESLLDDAQNQMKALNLELTETKKNISDKQQEEREIEETLRKIQTRLEKFELLLGKLQDEASLRIDLEKAKKEWKDYSSIKSQKAVEAEKKRVRLTEISADLEAMKATEREIRKGLEIVSSAGEAEVVAGDWRELLTKYEGLLSAQSSELKQLTEKRDSLQKQIEQKQREIRKRKCVQAEFEKLHYTEALEEAARRDADAADGAYQAANAFFTKACRGYGETEAQYRNAMDCLKEFGGEALPLNKIGKNFDERIVAANEEKRVVSGLVGETDAILQNLNKACGKTSNATEKYSRPVKCAEIALEADYDLQLKGIIKQIDICSRAVTEGVQALDKIMQELTASYGVGYADVGVAISSMQKLLIASGTEMRGDRYFTLCEHIDANMHTAELRISQIETDLAEFNKTKDDLVRQCMIQGRRMFEGLLQLSNNSKVMIQGKRRPMLKFDLPDAVDENIARAAIAAEIDKGTQEIAAKAADESRSESEVRKIAARTVGSKRLLRKFIGNENIVLRAYKIDQNPSNSGYRTWEQTQINNSGAEKFVVYFAVILALMAYTREENALDGKNNRSVLILDNPFGPISSRHVLEPMFEIARNYHVQMICLSDINKSDVMSCFTLVIRAVVKQFALSSREQLTHEGNERIEHGFYRSEQTTLF